MRHTILFFSASTEAMFTVAIKHPIRYDTQTHIFERAENDIIDATFFTLTWTPFFAGLPEMTEREKMTNIACARIIALFDYYR